MKQDVKNLTARLKAVPRRKLYEEIVEQIKGLIKNGGLRAGDQLPSERDLAQAFNVSRHSVRKAIRSLEEEEFLESRLGSGTYVMAGSSRDIVDHLARAVLMEKDRLAEIFQIRMMLEPQVAALAAEHAGKSDTNRLERIYAGQLKAGSWQNLVLLDSEFHLTLAGAAGNKVLHGVIKSIIDLLARTRIRGNQEPGSTRESIEGHARIIKAVKAGRPGEAEKAMQDHLDLVLGVVLKAKGPAAASETEIIKHAAGLA